MTKIVFPQIISPFNAQVLFVERQLVRFEKETPVRQAELRNRQLSVLVQHARKYSPYWRNKLQAFGSNIKFEDLPVLSRADLQTNKQELHCVGQPAMRGGDSISTIRTSGSTGKPVEVSKNTNMYSMLYLAQHLRLLSWHQLNTNNDLLVIKDVVEGQQTQGWGKLLAELGRTGKSFTKNMVENSPEELLAWVGNQSAPYLSTTPSMAFRLARLALAEPSWTKSLEVILTFGEVVRAEHRNAVRQAFGARIIDRYSCEEVGWMAFQCRKHDHYHTLPSTVYVEIVDEANLPVRAGEEGKVLVTPLHHYAMPLIRYDIGDRAIAGGKCDCGLRLPVIKEILGRERSFIRLPDGSSRLARLTGEFWRSIAPVEEYRVVQYKDMTIEAFVVAPRPLTPDKIAAMEAMLQRTLHAGLKVIVTQVEQLTWESRWKRLDIVRLDRLRGEDACSN